MTGADIREKLSAFRGRLNRDNQQPEDNPKVIRLDRTSENTEEKKTLFSFAVDESTGRVLVAAAVILVAAVLVFWLYNRIHTFDGYDIRTSIEKKDIDGTQYIMLDDHILKYSPDGVFYVDYQDQTKWSQAFSMQTPICHQCENTVVIAEQQGNQVYIYNERGPVGNYTTVLPIRQAYVAANGVSALVLQDADVTWINLYGTDGSQIASVKASMDISGYPMNVAISDHAKKMAVSYLGLVDGELTGRIAFYDFSSASGSDESHLTGSADFKRQVFPRIYFTDGLDVVAAGDGGFVIFHDPGKPENRTEITFDREIVSFFHDDSNEGFIFRSSGENSLYDVEVYNTKGKKVMQASFNFEYTGVRMDNREILLYDAKHLYAYRTSGKQKLSLTYERPVLYFAGIPGHHKYLVITSDTMDQIRVR